MITTWAELVLALVKLLGGLVSFLNTKQLLNAGGLQVIAAALQEQANGIAKASAAREKARADAAADPDGVLRKDDGWKRD